MRTRKALINSIINILSFFVAFIPNIILRKTFLDSLGSDILGLSSLYTNIIGWISIVEMGVGTAIVYSLYKPFADNDQNEIRAYIRFYGELYKKIGLIVLGAGVLISPCIRFFIKGNIDLKLATIGFLIYLLNSFLTYMFTHRLCILNVAQEEFKITIGTTISKLLIAIIQFVFLKFKPNFLIYALIQVVVNLIYYIIINIYITRKYQWLNSGEGTLDGEVKNNLLNNVKALFMHKIGGLVVLSTDNIVISKFVGLVELAKYTNYYTIISSLQTLITKGLSGITASIGNMLTDDDKEKAYDIHKKVFFMNFWIVSFIVISLYNTLNQFVALWVGEKYFLDRFTFIVILLNTYFASMRGSVERFQEGSGNYRQDRYAPLCEAAINLISSLMLVQHIGLAGVFVGTLISNFTVIFWTKPYVVYKYVFDRKLIEYFKMYFKYVIIAIIPLIVTNYCTIAFKYSYTVKSFIINCSINVVVINLIYIIIFSKSQEFRYYVNIFMKIVKKNNKKIKNEV